MNELETQKPDEMQQVEYSGDLPTMSAKTETEIAKIEAKNALEKATGMTIASPEELQQAIGMLSEIKSILKNIEDKKNAIIRPLNASIKEIRELFREPEEQLGSAEKSLKQGMLAYQQKVEAAAQKQMAKIEKKAAEGKLDPSKAVQKLSGIERVEGKVENQNGSVQFKKLKRVRITDLGKVPFKYLLSERVIEAVRMSVQDDALALGKMGEVIPGVEVYEVSTVAGS